MAATDSTNKGRNAYEITAPSGRKQTIMADTEFEARQKLAHQMTRRSDLTYPQAWAVVSPSHGRIKVRQVSTEAQSGRVTDPRSMAGDNPLRNRRGDQYRRERGME